MRAAQDPGPAAMVAYPQDDIAASLGADGEWFFAHKDGSPCWPRRRPFAEGRAPRLRGRVAPDSDRG